MIQFCKKIFKVKLFYSLGFTIAVNFLALALIPMIIVNVVTYNKAHESIKMEISKGLRNAAAIKTREIDAYFKQMLVWLDFVSESPNTANLLSELISFRNKFDRSLKEYVKSAEWQLIVENFAGDIQNFRRLFNIYNIFLIAANGDIIYNVTAESDLGTNILKDNSESKFSKACQRTIKTGKISFSDYSRYAPSKNLVFGFITSPIFSQTGDMSGLLAFQFDINPITNIMKSGFDLTKTSEIYMVGPDLTLRSGLKLDPEKDLIDKKILTLQTKLLKYENDEIRKCNNKHVKVLLYNGPFNKMVLGIHQHINIVNVIFTVIAEINVKEAFASIFKLRLWMIFMSGITALIIFSFTIILTRRIVKPVTKLSLSAEKVKDGDFSQIFDVKAKNEIGCLAETFNNMLDVIQKTIDKNLQEIELRKKLEHETQSALKTTEMILQHLPVGIIVVGIDKKIRRINEYASVMIGKNKEEIVGTICHDNICPAAVGKCPVLDLNKRVDKSERIILGPENEKIPVLKSVIQIIIDNEEVVLESFIDIRDLKEKEKDINKHIKDLAEANRKFEVLSSSILDREVRMVKLKQEVNSLLIKKGEKPKYSAPSEVMNQNLTIKDDDEITER